MSLLRNDKARDFRRSFPIKAYVGANGHGKSLLAVWDTMPDLDEGRLVYSTTRLLDWREPRPCSGVHVTAWGGDQDCEVETQDHSAHGAAHPWYRPLLSYGMLVEARHCVILMDEVTGGFGSGTSLPGAVANMLVQMRRSDRVLRYTTPAWARTQIVIRETTQAVTLCTGYAKKSVEGRQWASRRLFRALTYNAADMDEFSSADRAKPQKGKRVRAEKFALHWGPGLAGDTGGFAVYDTLAPVRSLSPADDSGRCLVCNGVRTAPRCSCADQSRSGASSAARKFRPVT